MTYAIKPYPDKLPLFYTLRLFPNLSDLNRAWWNGRKPKRNKVVGFFDKAENALPKLGTINLWRDDPELRLTLIHEATHATHYAARVLGFSTVTFENEEYIALWHEAIVSAAIKSLGKRLNR